MNRKLIFLSLSALFGLAFAGFTVLVKADAFKQLDFDLLTKLQYRIPHSFDYTFSILEILGRFEVTVAVLIAICLVRRRLWFAVAAFSIFVGMHFVEIIGKVFLHQPPPPFMFYRLEHIIHLPALYTPDTSSYPSGHAMRSAYIATLLFSIAAGKKAGAFSRILLLCSLIILPLSIGFAKVMLGAHWPTDIVGGLLLGAGAAYFVLSLTYRKKNVITEE